MNHERFLQFEFIRPARLVYKGPSGEAPSGGTEGADKPAAAPVDPTGAPSAAATRRGAETAAAVARGDEAAAAERKAADEIVADLAVPAPAPAEGATGPAEGTSSSAGAGPAETPPTADTATSPETGTVTGAAAEAAPPTAGAATETAESALPSGSFTEKQVMDVLGKPAFKDKLGDGKSNDDIKKLLADGTMTAAEHAIIVWARTPITESDETAAYERALKLLVPQWQQAEIDVGNTLPTPSEIDSLAADGKISYRDALVLRGLLKRKLEKGEELDRVSDEELAKFRKQVGLKSEDNDSIFDDIPMLGGLGGVLASIGKILTKMMEKGEKLVDALSAWLDRKFGGGDDKKEASKTFARSPIAGDEKFTVAKATDKGVDLKTDKPGSDITALHEGEAEVVAKDSDSITLKKGDAKFIYGHLNPLGTLAVGAKVAAGAKLGTLKGDTLNLQITNKENQQVKYEDVVALLKTFTKEATATPDATAVAASDTAATPKAGADAAAPAPVPAPAPAPAPAPPAAPTATPAPAAPTPATGGKSATG